MDETEKINNIIRNIDPVNEQVSEILNVVKNQNLLISRLAMREDALFNSIDELDELKTVPRKIDDSLKTNNEAVVKKINNDVNKRLLSTENLVTKEINRCVDTANNLDSHMSNSIANTVMDGMDSAKFKAERLYSELDKVHDEARGINRTVKDVLDSQLRDYEENTRERVKKQNKWLTWAIIVMAAISLFGGVISFLGAFCFYQAYVPLQELMASQEWGVWFFIILAAIILVGIAVRITVWVYDR